METKKAWRKKDHAPLLNLLPFFHPMLKKEIVIKADLFDDMKDLFKGLLTCLLIVFYHFTSADKNYILADIGGEVRNSLQVIRNSQNMQTVTDN